MNRVHTWKTSSQMEAHLTSSPVFMTPPERRLDQDLFSKGYSSNSPLILSSSHPLVFVSPFPPLSLIFPLFSSHSSLLLFHRSASMVCPTTLLAHSASCRLPPALNWGSPTSIVCNFPNPLYRCRILITPQSTNLILCQPLQRRHVVSRDSDTWQNWAAEKRAPNGGLLVGITIYLFLFTSFHWNLPLTGPGAGAGAGAGAKLYFTNWIKPSLRSLRHNGRQIITGPVKRGCWMVVGGGPNACTGGGGNDASIGRSQPQPYFRFLIY